MKKILCGVLCAALAVGLAFPPALREIYLKPFEIAVKSARSALIMSCYNMLNGTHIAFTPELITDVLREDWGFNCAVFSDWSPTMSHVSMLEEGNNFTSSTSEYTQLKQAYIAGQITRAQLENTARSTVLF